MTDHDVCEPYVLAIPVADIFADHSYQRPLDPQRVHDMAATFDQRLLGVIEVSDRGIGAHPRYAVVEGQHRWATVALRNPDDAIAARIHSGLTVAEEARLFLGVDVHRRRLTTWNRWTARRAHHDPTVIAIEATVASVGLRIDSAPKDGALRCTATLEKVADSRGGHALLRDSLRLLHQTWGPQQRAYDTALVGGMAVFLDAFGDEEYFDGDDLVDALIDLTPDRVSFFAKAKKAGGKHGTGTLPKFVAITLHERYNMHRRPGERLAMPSGFRGVLRPGGPSPPRPAATAAAA